MTFVEIVLSFVKILIVLLFVLNVAALLTWAERRQSAMMADRIGPNRAVIHIPSTLARIAVLLPPSFFGVIAIFVSLGNAQGRLAMERLTLNLELAILVGWFSLLLLCAHVRRHGAINGAEEILKRIDPRSIFFAGLLLHAAAIVAIRMLPLAVIPAGAKATGWLLGILFFLSGIYASSRVPDEKVALRLAGTIHILADTIKLFVKEDFIPKNADRLLHALAPILALFPALVTFAVIPFGSSLCFMDNGNRAFDFGDLTNLAPVVSRSLDCKGHLVQLTVADLNVGILYIFAMASTGVIGAAIAGWASDNKFSLLGGLRAASQMVSYEVAMGLSVVGLFIIYGAVRLQPMVEWQGQHTWGIFVQPVAFFLFLTALVAETKRIPFDQPEGESEIVAGYMVEYSGMKWTMFSTGEYVEVVTASAILVTLFFGGYQLPFLHNDGIRVAFGDTMLLDYKMTHLAVTAISVIAFFGKTLFVSWVQMFFRHTLPRFRYDQLMKLGWTKLLPLAIANILVTAIVVLGIDAAGPGVASALQLVADVTQGLVALGMLVGFVTLVAWILEPASHKRFLQSTAARFADQLGGTKTGPQQA
jgi:NADH-quinone oxidoreductase subunit H